MRALDVRIVDTRGWPATIIISDDGQDTVFISDADLAATLGFQLVSLSRTLRQMNRPEKPEAEARR